MEFITRLIIYWKIKKENTGKGKQLLYNTVASCRVNPEFQIENPVCLEVFLFIIFKKKQLFYIIFYCAQYILHSYSLSGCVTTLTKQPENI